MKFHDVPEGAWELDGIRVLAVPVSHPGSTVGFRLDSQYSETEYAKRVGWGHSSVAHAVGFAQKAGAGRLVLFHHDPDRPDAGVDRLLQ